MHNKYTHLDREFITSSSSPANWVMPASPDSPGLLPEVPDQSLLQLLSLSFPVARASADPDSFSRKMLSTVILEISSWQSSICCSSILVISLILSACISSLPVHWCIFRNQIRLFCYHIAELNKNLGCRCRHFLSDQHPTFLFFQLIQPIIKTLLGDTILPTI